MDSNVGKCACRVRNKTKPTCGAYHMVRRGVIEDLWKEHRLWEKAKSGWAVRVQRRVVVVIHAHTCTSITRMTQHMQSAIAYNRSPGGSGPRYTVHGQEKEQHKVTKREEEKEISRDRRKEKAGKGNRSKGEVERERKWPFSMEEKRRRRKWIRMEIFEMRHRKKGERRRRYRKWWRQIEWKSDDWRRKERVFMRWTHSQREIPTVLENKLSFVAVIIIKRKRERKREDNRWFASSVDKDRTCS